MKDDLQKSDSCGLKSERKKILTSSTCSLACLSTNLGAFCPMVVHLPSEKSILPYFSGPRGVAILDCDSHSQAGSTSPSPLGRVEIRDDNFWRSSISWGPARASSFPWESGGPEAGLAPLAINSELSSVEPTNGKIRPPRFPSLDY